MDASLWVALVGAMAAVGSAVFAYVQARAATDSRRDADEARDEARAARDESARLAGEANDAFRRQAEAQEEANRLKAAEMEPKDWGFGHVTGIRYRGTNTSKQVLLVESFDIQPDPAAALVHIQSNHTDGRFEYGDSFDFMVNRVSGLAPEKLTIKYRRESDAEDDYRTMYVAL
ncbi:hypothetical protein ACFZA2_15380 [Microbacterium sp. NPDC007973]|uniref:hypothetical protein n=1 Tax=Microbacterium sp. NPDC007973 TaxID=3364182 RepID=UPI0036E9316B